MSFFEDSAGQLFITAPDGQQLLCLNGPFSKPYVVPDDATKLRLRERIARFHRIHFWLFVSGSTISAALVRNSWAFGAAVLTVALLSVAIFKLGLRSETRALARATERVPLREYFGSVARHRSWTEVWAGLAFTLLFVGVAGFMLIGDKPLEGGVGLIVFGPLALVWGYIIKRKFELGT